MLHQAAHATDISQIRYPLALRSLDLRLAEVATAVAVQTAQCALDGLAELTGLHTLHLRVDLSRAADHAAVSLAPLRALTALRTLKFRFASLREELTDAQVADVRALTGLTRLNLFEGAPSAALLARLTAEPCCRCISAV